VEVAVNLGLSAVLGQEATEDAHAADPHDLGGEAGLAGTTALTVAAVAALGLGLGAAVNAEAGVDDVGLLNNVAVLDQLADVLACGRLSGERGHGGETPGSRGGGVIRAGK
jgi:hypothetical protein